MPESLVAAVIVLVALWGVAVLLAGVWSLCADWTLEREPGEFLIRVEFGDRDDAA